MGHSVSKQQFVCNVPARPCQILSKFCSARSNTLMTVKILLKSEMVKPEAFVVMKCNDPNVIIK